MALGGRQLRRPCVIGGARVGALVRGDPLSQFRRISAASLDKVDRRARKPLFGHGFGVLTQIDAQAPMKQKLDVDIPGYRILGACNPKMAHQSIGLEPRVGAMLPCNVIFREVADDVEVSAIDPVASMQAIDNAELKTVAAEVRQMLAKVVATV